MNQLISHASSKYGLITADHIPFSKMGVLKWLKGNFTLLSHNFLKEKRSY